MRRLRREDRGSAALEVVGVLPVVAIVLLALLQGIAAAYATHATNQAVRDGARALSLGSSAADAELAVTRSLPSGLAVEHFTVVAGGDGVRLEVRVPRIGVFPQLTVDRTAIMPDLAP
ncbi:TadE/TadG family type IV pilus assembly protein [Pengzhenrongella sicca]|uniref:Pilus assembly protein n=1 Tax=Pengzhenrongella sicca TaxID=2819238 RepID=A0A8A4ZDC4_9MICO|nr:TadE family protein [Pengzhenrongella sicca]QTE29952.1 pilus assembly protein [Pengzhenrongella sicca]